MAQGRTRWRAKGDCRTDWAGHEAKCWHQCWSEAWNLGWCPTVKTMRVNFLPAEECGLPENHFRVCECVCKYYVGGSRWY
jgi:hypothetical protein